MVSEILLLPYEGNQMKEKLRPFYSELNGYLSQAPIVEKQSDLITDEDVWTQYNKTVNSICNISQEDLSRFLIKNIRDVGVRKSITLISYKQKLMLRIILIYRTIKKSKASNLMMTNNRILCNKLIKIISNISKLFLLIYIYFY